MSLQHPYSGVLHELLRFLLYVLLFYYEVLLSLQVLMQGPQTIRAKKFKSRKSHKSQFVTQMTLKRIMLWMTALKIDGNAQ